MTIPSWLSFMLTDCLAILGRHPWLERLVFASLDFAALALAVGLLLRLPRLRWPRLAALLWLTVLAKPLVALVVGAPLPWLSLERPPAIEITESATPQMVDQFTMPEISNQPLPSTRPAINIETLVARGVLALWLAGALFFASRLMVDYRRLRRMIHSTAEPAPWLRERLNEIAKQMGLRSSPPLRVTSDLESPALAGFWRPVILLPAWLGEEADPERVDWSLRHELMHWRLRDPLAELIGELVRILFFFHPAAWLAGAKLKEAMEMACDRALIRSVQEAEAYAEQLYRLLTKIHTRRRVPVAGGLFAGRTQISRRITSLLTDPLRAPARLGVLSLCLVGLIALVSMSVGCGVKVKPAAERKTPGGFEDVSADSISMPDASGFTATGQVRLELAFGDNRLVIMGDQVDMDKLPDGKFHYRVKRDSIDATNKQLGKDAIKADNERSHKTVWASADEVIYSPLKPEGILQGNVATMKHADGKTVLTQGDRAIVTQNPSGKMTISLEQDKNGSSPKNSAYNSSTPQTTSATQQRAQNPVSPADQRASEDFSVRGWQLWNQRKLPEAEAQFKQAVEKNPANANAWNGLGWAQQNQGKVLNAQHAFEQVLKLEPKHAAVLNGLGWIAKTQGKTDAAVAYWKRAVEALPQATAALNGLATTTMERKQYQDAAKYYAMWLKAEPNNVQATAGLRRAEALAAGQPAFSKDELYEAFRELANPNAPPFVALNAIIDMGPEAVPDLLEIMKINTNWQIPKALGAIGDPRAVMPLIEQLEQNPESPRKEVIVEALEKITNQKLGADAPAWRKWSKELEIGPKTE